MTTPQWTDDHLTHAIELAWQTGRDYQQRLHHEAADDIRHATTGPPARTYEQRVQARITEMERCAAVVRQQIRREAAGAPQRPWGWHE